MYNAIRTMLPIFKYFFENKQEITYLSTYIKSVTLFLSSEHFNYHATFQTIIWVVEITRCVLGLFLFP